MSTNTKTWKGTLISGSLFYWIPGRMASGLLHFPYKMTGEVLQPGTRETIMAIVYKSSTPRASMCLPRRWWETWSYFQAQELHTHRLINKYQTCGVDLGCLMQILMVSLANGRGKCGWKSTRNIRNQPHGRSLEECRPILALWWSKTKGHFWSLSNITAIIYFWKYDIINSNYRRYWYMASYLNVWVILDIFSLHNNVLPKCFI